MVARTVLAAIVLLGAGAVAHADVSAFVGAVTGPTPRPSIGVAWGRAGERAGFEVELARSVGAGSAEAPSLFTIAADAVVPLTSADGGPSYFGIGGIGGYGESVGGGRGSSGLAVNVGAGAILPLRGRLRLRLDYRLFFLRGSSDAEPVRPRRHRFSAGLSFAH